MDIVKALGLEGIGFEQHTFILAIDKASWLTAINDIEFYDQIVPELRGYTEQDVVFEDERGTIYRKQNTIGFTTAEQLLSVLESYPSGHFST